MSSTHCENGYFYAPTLAECLTGEQQCSTCGTINYVSHGDKVGVARRIDERLDQLEAEVNMLQEVLNKYDSYDI